MKKEEIKVGTILMDKVTGAKRKVLSVGGMYHLSKIDNYNDCSQDHWTFEELNRGYTIHYDKPALKIDDSVLVGHSEDEVRYKRYFKEWKGKEIVCWEDGRTSWTTTGCVITWEFWKLPEDNEK